MAAPWRISPHDERSLACAQRLLARRMPGQAAGALDLTDQFAIGTLRVNAPTHSLGFWGPKFVWQITHAGWKLLSGIERR